MAKRILPAIVYLLWFRNHGIAALRRGIMNFVGISPVRESLYGMVASVDGDKRSAWLDQFRQLGRRAA